MWGEINIEKKHNSLLIRVGGLVGGWLVGWWAQHLLFSSDKTDFTFNGISFVHLNTNTLLSTEIQYTYNMFVE